jgi:DNA-binding CsgD family transcriptional regulator
MEQDLARVRLLTPAVRDTLVIAAVLGRSFDYDLLLQVSGQPEEELLDALEAAVAAGVLKADETRFHFAEPALQEALYGSMLAPRRARWHRLAAVHATDPELIGLHLAAAGDPAAVAHLRTAGDRAMREGARSRAADLYRQALTLTSHDDPGRLELLLLAGAASRALDLELARTWTEEALRTARATGDAVVTALARYQLALQFGQQESAWRGPRLMDTAHQELAALWRDPRLEALHALITGRPPHAPGAPDGLAQAYLWSGRPAEAETVVRASQADGGTALQGEADQWVLAEALLLRGDLDEAFHCYDRSVREAADRRDYAVAAFRAAWLLDLFAHERGHDARQVEELQARAGELGALARERAGSAPYTWRGPLLGFWYLRGQWQVVRQEVEAFRQAGRPGDLWAPYYGRWAVRIALAQGDGEAARQALAPWLPMGGPGQAPRYGDYGLRMGLMTEAARLALHTGDRAGARAWLDTVDAWASGPRPSLLHFAHNRLVWAEYYRTAGDPEAARTAAGEALDLGRRLGSQTGLALPACCLLGGDHLDAALALARASGSPHLLAQVERERGAAREALPHGLTRREAEVARLVAEGLTDKEVGARLFVSPRTVDGHLRNIFNKLGFQSRAGLAAWAARVGLLE